MNVVSRKRVQARKGLIRRALNPDVKASSLYVYKHSIVIDSSVTLLQPTTEANDSTTYDINDILRTEAEVFEEFRLQRDLRGWSRGEDE